MKTLNQITVDGINKLKINELRVMCRAEDLPVGNGKKADLIARLVTKKTATIDKYAGAGTLKCQICSLAVKVMSTKRKALDDGRTLVIRQVKCAGKHGHTYPIKTFE